MMNLYNANSGKVRKIEDRYDARGKGEHIERAETEHTHARNEAERAEKSAERQRPMSISSLINAKRISEKINSALPGKMNIEDLLIFIILMLLYLEKEDEEILIILSVLLLGDLNIMRGKADKSL